MSVRADTHLHSSYSGDSDAPMEAMVERGIALGLEEMCFTEHMDIDFPVSEDTPAGTFDLNVDSYFYGYLTTRAAYQGRIRLLFGLELGLQPHLAARHAALVNAWPFDFIIGSSHLCMGLDPYYPSFWENRDEEAAFRDYFTSIIDNLETFTDYDVYGHLDYVVRYSPDKDKYYTYEKYADLFDRILELLLENGIGLEINTAGLRKGLKDAHPCREILKRYHRLGGSILTIGSDAHRPEDLGRDFHRAEEMLKDCGYDYYTVFEKRSPKYIKL